MASLPITGRDRGAAPPPQLSVSVVTYNSERHLPAFLESLRRQTAVTWEAFFFDNASRDGTRELIRTAALGELISSDANVGYGRGHNRNFVQCRGRHFLVLNPDLQFGPELFAGLVSHLDAHAETAVAGPRVLEGPARRLFPPRHFYPGEGMIALEPGLRRREIAWLSGCCLIVRREAFEKLAGFDPDYFLYQEDTDFCLRARRAGYRIGYAHEIVVHHLHRQSQPELSDYEYARRVFRGSAVFWEKHYAPADVLRLVRFQYWASRLLLGLGPARAWMPELPHVLSEARLRARRDACREWLEARGHRPVGLAGVPGKIALRQCRLAVEWMVQRRFPVDDY
jgi:GT2 family glycosyltransferase